MTVRMNIENGGGGLTTISVVGWIEGDDEARELLRVVRETQAPVRLDLAELQTSDANGLVVLNTLAQDGIRITGASDFIKLLLKSTGRTSPISIGQSYGGAP